MGHHVQLWDYRREILPPCEGKECDIFLGLKTLEDQSSRVRADVPKVVYWPDGFHRTPLLAGRLQGAYDFMFTMSNPYPLGWRFLPGAWDETIHLEPGDLFHKELHADARPVNKLFFGTRTTWKEQVARAVAPDVLFGNEWNEGAAKSDDALYLNDLVEELTRVKVVINAHRDFHTGVGRRLFESIACAPTITDMVPGIVEIFGDELAHEMSYSSPREARLKADLLVADPEQRHAMWLRQYRAIVPYTYTGLAWHILKTVVPDLLQVELGALPPGEIPA